MKNTIQLHTVSNIAHGIIANALESGRFLGVTWPHDKEFAVVMTHSTWPVGWSNQFYVRFYDTEEEMIATFADTDEWAKCEDNYFARRAYRWDWGPVEMPEHSHDAYRIPTKLNSYMSVCTENDFGYDGYMRRAKENDRRAELLKAATPKEFNATAYSMYEQNGLIPGDGEWPFVQLEKATSPLFISATELKRIQDASKDVNMNEPPVLSGAPDLSDDDGYW